MRTKRVDTLEHIWDLWKRVGRIRGRKCQAKESGRCGLRFP